MTTRRAAALLMSPVPRAAALACLAATGAGSALPGIGGLLRRAALDRLAREHATHAGADAWRAARDGLRDGDGWRDREGWVSLTAWEDDALLTDLTAPASWYPVARKSRRQIVAHIGPTNSGKTHQALEALKAAESGAYCGPLRLLAWEVAEKLNAAGVPSDLITGQEQRTVPGARHVASTVEMADVGRPVQVGVVDEVQLLADAARGAAFTRALLGLPARRLHVCGDPSVLPLLERLAADAGDSLEVRQYARLAPLAAARRCLPGPAAAQRGDCLVAFSRREVHGVKREVEAAGRHSCCVVYGALPPASRAQQAQLFNAARSGYNVLAASDAVGMGLNLNIRRVVFTSLAKFDGVQQRRLTPPEVRQIAGRAGRFGSSWAAGSVTCLDPADLRYLRAALETPARPIAQAALLPRFEQLALFLRRSRGRASLAGALAAFADRATLAGHYRLGDFDNLAALAAALEHLDLGLREHYTFAMSPCDATDAPLLAALLCFATAYSLRGSVGGRMCGPLPPEPPRTEAALQQLEALHREYDLYCWLAFRLPGAFPDRPLVEAQRARCSELIRQGLELLGRRCGRAAKRQARAQPASPAAPVAAGAGLRAGALPAAAALGGARGFAAFAGVRHFPKHLLRRPGEPPRPALPAAASEPLPDDGIDPQAPIQRSHRPRGESRSERAVRKREEGIAKQAERDFGKGILPPFSDEEEEWQAGGEGEGGGKKTGGVPQFGPGVQPKRRKAGAKRRSSKPAPFPLS